MSSWLELNTATSHILYQHFKVQCLKVFCYYGNKPTILLFYSIFRTTPEVSSKLYFVEICQVSEKLWLFNHKRADFWLPNFGFKRSLISLLKLIMRVKIAHSFLQSVKSVPRCQFKLACVVLQLAVKEFFETPF